LQRIDILEKKLEERVSSQRIRALNLLDELPHYRRSTLRLYVTHEYHPAAADDATGIGNDDTNKTGHNNQWKLVLEGKLLVDHLDHQNAVAVDQSAKEAALKYGRIYQTQSNQVVDVADMTSRERAATRFMHDREGEDPLIPINFAHYFDEISVTFQDMDVTDNKGDGDGDGDGRDTNDVDMEQDQELRQEKQQQDGKKSCKSLVWHRLPPSQSQSQSQAQSQAQPETQQKQQPLEDANNSNETNQASSSSGSSTSMDTHAFHAIYMDQHHGSCSEPTIIGTIRLHRKYLEARYKPSKKLCETLFPNLPDQHEQVMQGRDKQSTQEIADVSIDNHVHIPTLFSMDEILTAIELYIRDKGLYDDSDPTLIHNDSKLETLFDCKEMTMSTIKQLLMSMGHLLPAIPGTPGDSPIVLRYVMKKDTASTAVNQYSGVAEQKEEEQSKQSDVQQDKEPRRKRRRRTISPTMSSSDDDPKTNVQKDLLPTIPNVLSCDVDVDVAHLFHSHCRDILRRIKMREYEYTSCRTKALRTVEQTKALEDVIKERLENIVKQKGLTMGHQPILAALAKEASEGSEARIAAHLDSKTALLLDRLEGHCEQAHACWTILNSFMGEV